jgi:mannose-1-phosphate guanylyltransferase
MREVTKGRIKADHILDEPAARNTAACIGYAAIEIVKKYGDGIMVVTPSDAYIKDGNKFAEVLKVAVGEAEKADVLVTIGITPTFAATGYGYIKYDDSASNAKPVLQFVEKPCLEKAEEYLKSGDYCWNSGMFIWKASLILQKFKQLLPEVYDCLEKMADSFGTVDERNVIDSVYPAIPSISVDYGIMEKSDGILVIPAEFGWNDVGSWDMLGVLHEADDNGNVTVGDTLVIDSTNSTVYSQNKLVATVGVDNLVVVQTDDAVLVCPKDKCQDVKKIVDKLKENGREQLL